MELKEIEIYNYRSIKEQSIKFEELKWKKCMILVWINEWWKSNILNAINTININPDYDKDCNKEAKNTLDTIWISYTFSCTKEELELNKYLPEDLCKSIKIKYVFKWFEIWKTSGESRTNIYIDVPEKILSEFLCDKENGNIFKKEKVYSWVDKLTRENISSLAPDYEFLSVQKLEDYIDEKVSYEPLMPKIIFRKSASEYLINNKINLNEFKENTSLSIPLRNIFNISGYTNIKEVIENMWNDVWARKELWDVLSEKITAYINKIWPEHKIKLEVNIEESLNCNVNVIDNDNSKKRFTMEQRSDWFKQFISILLNLSIENAEWKLKNCVILLDEPEVHLHPSGIKYLRDELLEIANNNIVVLSTHSIYMIDKTCLNRHKKIEKIQWETQIIPIDDNPYKEEVIYESLWTSILEYVNPNVILLEWKTDRDILNAFTEKFKDEIDPLEITIISADSVDKMDKYAKFFNWKFIKWFIIVDSDDAWIKMKKKILWMDNYDEKNVFELKDCIKIGKEKFELEDLLPIDVILEQTNNFFWINIQKSSIKSDKPVFDELNRLIKEWKKNVKNEELQALKQNISIFICKEVKKLDKETLKKKYKNYCKFLVSFHKKIKKKR